MIAGVDGGRPRVTIKVLRGLGIGERRGPIGAHDRGQRSFEGRKIRVRSPLEHFPHAGLARLGNRYQAHIVDSSLVQRPHGAQW